jgi:hypothetical protein
MDQNQNPEPTPTSQIVGLKEQFTTVTPLSKFLAMVLFVALPFVGFWFGQHFKMTTGVGYEKNIKNSSLINTETDPTESPIPITSLSSDRTLDNDDASESYRIVDPKVGDIFYEDEPITVQWEDTGSIERLEIYLLPYKCSKGLCDDPSRKYDPNFPFPILVGFSKNNTTTSTISLSESSPQIAYPEGEYRIALHFAHEGPTTALAVSDPFTIIPPKDKARDIKIGSQRGDFTVTSISPYTLETVGTTTLRGFAWVNEMFGMPCFDVVADDYKKLPRPDFDERSGWFCFNNEISRELLNTEATATIQIANYYVDGRPMATADRADFVQIVK